MVCPLGRIPRYKLLLEVMLALSSTYVEILASSKLYFLIGTT